MDTGKAALVLTGNVLPGYDAEAVWPALADYFRMEHDVFDSQVLARLPMTIKESDDPEKLRKLRTGANAVGAEAELVALDGSNFFVLPGSTPRGPLPRAWIAQRIDSGEWPATLRVAAVGSNTWTTWSEVAGPATAGAAPGSAPKPAPLAPDSADANSTYVMPRMDAAAMAAAAGQAIPPAHGANARPVPAQGPALPPGPAIHAGFWRRCAALVLDSLILLIPTAALRFAVSAVAGEIAGMVVTMLATWLYFALMEASAMQATIGKRVMQLKVTDDQGRRIGFGRSTGRYFGKIVSSIILGIGYMLAGWTARKQALHDMMASCCVVFRSVEPGQPMPAIRPPMPWYGWVLNALPFIAAVGFVWSMGAMMRAMGM